VAVLHAVEGPLRGQKFHIPEKPKLIVGRYEVYDVIVPDPSISRKHFAFERRSDGLYLIDLGSLNGTQLNGLRVSTAKIEHGDRITSGQTTLLYDESDSPSAPSITPRAGAEDESVEIISDEDILADGPISLDVPAQEPPPTIEYVEEEAPDLQPDPEPEPEPESEPARGRKRRAGRGESDLGRRVTERITARRGSSRRRGKGDKKSSGQNDSCAACGRDVPPEEVQGGEGAQTRLGYVCGRCVEKRQKSGQKGSLEKFIRERQRRRQ
jgi:hypothetical protein